MRTAGIRTHDLVLVDRRGWRFEAIVSGREPDGRRFSIRPLRPAISYRSASAREIVGHWRARPRAAGGVSTRPIRVDDIVHFTCEEGGVFFGTVLKRDGSRLRIRPLERNAKAPTAVEPAAVVRHYARQGRRRHGA